MLWGPDLEMCESAILDAIELREADGDTNIAYQALTTGNPDPGCHYHPNVSTHEAMAAQLAEAAAQTLGWD